MGREHQARINIPFGATLTTLAELPEGAKRSTVDPFAEKKTPWKKWAVVLALFMALAMAWDKGYIQRIFVNAFPLFSSQQSNATLETPAPTQPPANQTTAPDK